MLALVKKQPEYEFSLRDDDPVIEAEQAKLDDLLAREAALEIRLRDSQRNLDRTKAIALLDGGEIPSTPSRAENDQELKIVREAIPIQRERLETARRATAGKRREELTPTRQKLLREMDKAIKGLIESCVEYERFLDGAEQADLIVPQARIGGKWASAGIEIGGASPMHVIERLRAWREAFQRTGFLNG